MHVYIMAQEDVEVPGSDAFYRLVDMHVMYGWAVNTKVCTPW